MNVSAKEFFSVFGNDDSPGQKITKYVFQSPCRTLNAFPRSDHQDPVEIPRFINGRAGMRIVSHFEIPVVQNDLSIFDLNKFFNSGIRVNGIKPSIKQFCDNFPAFPVAMSSQHGFIQNSHATPIRFQ